MKLKTIPAAWLVREGRRFDCGPFLYGAVEAKITIENLPVRKDRLGELTSGHNGGIYNGPQFVRNYVEDAANGVPFVTSGTMLEADLTRVSLLRKRDAESSKLAYLRLEEGMTLIACSGSRSVGAMGYARPEMAGMWSSQDCIKVVPDTTKVRPGYLYAYLKCRYGFLLVTAGTYGAAVLHLEPEHIRDLPVPRFPSAVEERVHELIHQAAQAHSTASQRFSEGYQLLQNRLGLPSLPGWNTYRRPLAGRHSASGLQERFDAFYYCEPNRDAESAFMAARKSSPVELATVAEVFIPGFFKRLYVNEPAHGYPFLKGAEVFDIHPRAERFLMRRVAEDYQLVVHKGMILIQDSGQLNGLIGRSVLVGATLEGFTVTNNMVRVTAKDPTDTGYLYVVLSSEFGTRLVKRSASGSSIPHLDERRVREMRIPWAKEPVRKEVGTLAMQASELRDQGCRLETEAVTLVERTIEAGGA